MTTPEPRRPSGNNTPSGGRRRDTNRIVPQPARTGRQTTGSSATKSRGSHQSHEHSTRTDPGKVKDQAAQSNENPIIVDRVEATKRLINWAVEDLANTIGAFKEMQKILQNQEKKWDKDVENINIFGPVNLTKKHWDFDTKISEYKEKARTEIAYWQNAEREAKAEKAKWEKNLEFLNGKVFAEAIKMKPGDKNKTSWEAVWEAGKRNAPWQEYEQINATIASYYAKTWQGENLEPDRFSSSPGRELKRKLDEYVKRSGEH